MPSWTVVCSQTLPDVLVVSKTTHICPFRVRFGKSDPKNLAFGKLRWRLRWVVFIATRFLQSQSEVIRVLSKLFVFLTASEMPFVFKHRGNFNELPAHFECILKGKISQNWPYLCIPLHWKDAPKMGNLMTPETCQDLGINFCCDSGTGSSGRWRTVGVPSTKPPESRQMFRRFTTQTQAFLLFCGRNPAPVDMEKLPLFTGLWLYLSQVVQDFFHQQYQSRSILTTLRRSFWEEIAEQNKNCTQIVQTMSLCFAFL